MEEQKEPDYDQQYKESFTKKIPFPMLKYDVCKLNPAFNNYAYTLATASVHDGTEFTLYTSPQTKMELAPMVEKLKGEDAIAKAEKKLKEQQEQQKLRDERKDEEEDDKAAEDNQDSPVENTEEEKKKTNSNDPTERAIMILNDRRAKERDQKKNEAPKEERKESDLNLQDLAMGKAKSSKLIDENKAKDNALSKENETLKFEKVEVDETFNQNLVNCTKVLTLWEIEIYGYRKIKEIFLFEQVSNQISVSDNGKFLLLWLSDNRTHMIYNAETLELVSKKELTAKTDDGGEVTYFYDSKLSFDGSYLIGGDSYSRYIFDQNLNFVRKVDGRNMYSIWQYSKTQFLGCKNADDTYTKTNLVAIDILTDKEEVIYNFESYISMIYLNQDKTGFCYDKYPKIYYVDLKNKGNECKEIIKEYYSMNAITFSKDYIGVLYMPNWKNMWCAVYKDGKLVWKQVFHKTYVYSYGFKFMEGDEQALILFEQDCGKMIINTFTEEKANSYGIKAIRNITFQYPLILYVWGTRELWVQDLNNKVSIYYFDDSILAMENISKVIAKQSSTIDLGIVLDKHSYVQTTIMRCNTDTNLLEYDKRQINKSEIVPEKIKGFYRITLQNPETKSIENAVMLHQKDSLAILSLESKGIKYEINKKVKKTNVIFMQKTNVIIFWDDKGDKLELMRIPYDPTSAKSIIKVYEADEDIRYCKQTMINGVEYLAIVDEPKYVKILKVEESGSQKFSKVSIYKEYFVDTYFSSSSDVNSIKGYGFCNEMMYSSNGVNILQERGKEKEGRFYSLYYSGYSLEYGNTKFPLCSEDFILFALNSEYDSTYTYQKQYLMLAPPMNSYRIKQREDNTDTNTEFFCHFDDKYIISSNYASKYETYHEMESYDVTIILKVYLLNGEVIQTIKLPQFKKTYRPYFSQSGEYFVIPIETIDEQTEEQKKELVTFRINKTDDYKKSMLSEELRRQESLKSKAIINVEPINRYRVFNHNRDNLIKDDMWTLEQPLFIDNKGNVVYLHVEEKIFQINGINHWDDFQRRLNDKGLTTDDFDIYKFGACTAIIKQEEDILALKFDERGIKSAKLLKHKALDIPDQCDLDNLIVSKNPRYLIILYDLGGAKTVIVWDIERNIEHTNFLGRKDDQFLDYISGKNSILGFLCFDQYIVDLDLGVPIPFMSKNKITEDRLWGQGMRINSSEDVMLGNGMMITPLCYKDIYYYKNKSLDNLDVQKVMYYMNKKSVAFDYIDNYDNLKNVLNIFENNPLYYIMLVLENNEGKSPLQLAIENNSARIIELMLNCLLKLGHFSLSRKIFINFTNLFKMNLRSFEKYLNSCYFVTEQMKSINKLELKGDDETIRDHYPCSILDKEFYKKYNVPDKDGKIMGKENEDKEIKKNQVAPSYDKPSSYIQGDISQSNDMLGDDDNDDKVNVFDEEENTLKRVSIKGIEFDWIFQGDNCHQFLKDLSGSQNINLFGQDIIRDIILFQWKYFKEVIILKLFIPYIIYFVLFCLYTTWLLEKQHLESDDSGSYHLTSYAFGAIILLFNIFWAYVEIRQILFHGLDYITSFWNMLDLFSVIMNTTVVIMDFADASFEDTNRVAAISVLVLYFKLFYFLRIFFATAYLVRMIIEIMIDMKFFVGVLMIATIAFANAFYILGRNSEEDNLAGDNFIDAFIFSYKMGLGDFITDDFGTRDEEFLWIFFLLDTLIILIVLLNLVIAIMGDTFDRVQETQENSMLQELSNMIRENEFLFSRSRAFRKAKYIVVIEPEKAEGGGNVSWEGKLNQLKTFIEESSEKHISHLKKLQDEVETIATMVLDDKMKPTEDRINHKLSACDTKIDTIRKGIEKLYERIDELENEKKS
ncbi:unnamed protein product [Moneuplotes crassus]|uniref:Ion transport domain-containing protein n=3 Tax=Euplotes crassus TaxID=5936 RepID=A0AAD1XYK2_EUPCR|nr:unnamed protein product [Moneuplotes crassus]